MKLPEFLNSAQNIVFMTVAVGVLVFTYTGKITGDMYYNLAMLVFGAYFGSKLPQQLTTNTNKLDVSNTTNNIESNHSVGL